MGDLLPLFGAPDDLLPVEDEVRFGSVEGGASAGGGGGMGGMDVGGIITAFAEVAKTVGGLIQMGFDTEYAPNRRMKLLQEAIPAFYNAIKVLESAARHADKKGDSALATKIRNTRKMLVPLPFPPHVKEGRLQVDDSLSIETWIEMLTQKANKRRAGPKRLPITGDGGNIRTVRTALQLLFSEALTFSLLPEAVAVPGGLMPAKQSAQSAMDFIFGRSDGLKTVYPDDADAAMGRVPKQLRERLLNRFLEWEALGWMPGSIPLPSYLYGFSVTGKDKLPPISPTLEAYRVLSTAVGQNRLSPDAMARLKVLG